MNAITIGQKLVDLREQKNKTQAQVAEDLGLSTSAITMYENGKRIPKDEIKIKLANYYDTSVLELFFT